MHTSVSLRCVNNIGHFVEPCSRRIPQLNVVQDSTYLRFRRSCYIYLSLSLFYSCYSHLKYRASVKRFVSLQFLNLRVSVGLLGQGNSPSKGYYLTQTEYTQISMPSVGFEPTIPVFERTKIFHTSDHAATVIDHSSLGFSKNSPFLTETIVIRLLLRNSGIYHRLCAASSSDLL
jgi:hypothetical protein